MLRIAEQYFACGPKPAIAFAEPNLDVFASSWVDYAAWCACTHSALGLIKELNNAQNDND